MKVNLFLVILIIILISIIGWLAFPWQQFLKTETTEIKTVEEVQELVYNAVRTEKGESKIGITLPENLKFDISKQYPVGYFKYDNKIYYGDNNISWIYPADVETFEVIQGTLRWFGGEYKTYTYAKDKNYAYYKGFVLNDADVSSLVPIENGVITHFYARDNNSVFYGRYKMPAADTLTFKPLWEHVWEGCRGGEYATDKDNFFYEEYKILGVDRNSFKNLINGYAVDKNHVYLEGKIQEGLNPTTFTTECLYG